MNATPELIQDMEAVVRVMSILKNRCMNAESDTDKTLIDSSAVFYALVDLYLEITKEVA